MTTATIVFALAHCAPFGVKYCCEPYKPVGSRLAIVTFAYGSAFVGLGDAVALALALLAALAVAGFDAAADGVADAGAETDADTKGFTAIFGPMSGAELRVARRTDERAAANAAECAFPDCAPAVPPLDDKLRTPYDAAAAVLVGTTIAAVTTAANAVGLALGLRCAPMKLCRASPPTAYRVS